MYHREPKTLFVSSKKRLARALDALSRERKQRQRELAEIQVRRGLISSSIERLAGCIKATAKTAVVDENGKFDAKLYLVAITAETRLAHEINELEERLVAFDRNVTCQVEERLRASAVREQAVETLVSRQKTVAKQQQEHRELRQMDECARNRWLSDKTKNLK